MSIVYRMWRNCFEYSNEIKEGVIEMQRCVESLINCLFTELALVEHRISSEFINSFRHYTTVKSVVSSRTIREMLTECFIIDQR